ncbi:hypothetical protein [Weissella bombi]|uniref:Uncharacterized protein n=1 Tax=Weissella bombi TaxID=1505725 RepID=A0A1C4C6V3_9LACO|nr:hypothetical protein [Weissella bombi]SCC14788.1 hypothetical protein GA0061074_1252 [Weissella bombi]
MENNTQLYIELAAAFIMFVLTGNFDNVVYVAICMLFTLALNNDQ